VLTTRETALFKWALSSLLSLSPTIDRLLSVLAEDAIRSAIRDYRSKRSAVADRKPADLPQDMVMSETVTPANPTA